MDDQYEKEFQKFQKTKQTSSNREEQLRLNASYKEEQQRAQRKKQERRRLHQENVRQRQISHERNQRQRSYSSRRKNQNPQQITFRHSRADNITRQHYNDCGITISMPKESHQDKFVCDDFQRSPSPKRSTSAVIIHFDKNNRNNTERPDFDQKTQNKVPKINLENTFEFESHNDSIELSPNKTKNSNTNINDNCVASDDISNILLKTDIPSPPDLKTDLSNMNGNDDKNKMSMYYKTEQQYIREHEKNEQLIKHDEDWIECHNYLDTLNSKLTFIHNNLKNDTSNKVYHWLVGCSSNAENGFKKFEQLIVRLNLIDSAIDQQPKNQAILLKEEKDITGQLRYEINDLRKIAKETESFLYQSIEKLKEKSFSLEKEKSDMTNEIRELKRFIEPLDLQINELKNQSLLLKERIEEYEDRERENNREKTQLEIIYGRQVQRFEEEKRSQLKKTEDRKNLEDLLNEQEQKVEKLTNDLKVSEERFVQVEQDLNDMESQYLGKDKEVSLIYNINQDLRGHMQEDKKIWEEENNALNKKLNELQIELNLLKAKSQEDQNIKDRMQGMILRPYNDLNESLDSPRKFDQRKFDMKKFQAYWTNDESMNKSPEFSQGRRSMQPDRIPAKIEKDKAEFQRLSKISKRSVIDKENIIIDKMSKDFSYDEKSQSNILDDNTNSKQSEFYDKITAKLGNTDKFDNLDDYQKLPQLKSTNMNNENFREPELSVNMEKLNKRVTEIIEHNIPTEKYTQKPKHIPKVRHKENPQRPTIFDDINSPSRKKTKSPKLESANTIIQEIVEIPESYNLRNSNVSRYSHITTKEPEEDFTDFDQIPSLTPHASESHSEKMAVLADQKNKARKRQINSLADNPKNEDEVKTRRISKVVGQIIDLNIISHKDQTIDRVDNSLQELKNLNSNLRHSLQKLGPEVENKNIEFRKKSRSCQEEHMDLEEPGFVNKAYSRKSDVSSDVSWRNI